MVLRAVALPGEVAGRLFLHRMPGRSEAYADAEQEIVGCRVSRVVCFTPLAEVKTKSPLYTQAIEAARLPWRQEMFAAPPRPGCGVLVKLQLGELPLED
jgi:hypothetical protein